MRIRRKKWAKEELENSKFYIDKPDEFKGTWKGKFKNTSLPLYVELGCGKGLLVLAVFGCGNVTAGSKMLDPLCLSDLGVKSPVDEYTKAEIFKIGNSFCGWSFWTIFSFIF